MGKSLNGKELGKGISQRKDGYYTARYTDNTGKRHQKYFKKLLECKRWLADRQYEKYHGGINAGSQMTMNAWYEYWKQNIKQHVRKISRKNN